MQIKNLYRRLLLSSRSYYVCYICRFSVRVYAIFGGTSLVPPKSSTQLCLDSRCFFHVVYDSPYLLLIYTDKNANLIVVDRPAGVDRCTSRKSEIGNPEIGNPGNPENGNRKSELLK